MDPLTLDKPLDPARESNMTEHTSVKHLCIGNTSILVSIRTRKLNQTTSPGLKRPTNLGSVRYAHSLKLISRPRPSWMGTVDIKSNECQEHRDAKTALTIFVNSTTSVTPRLFIRMIDGLGSSRLTRHRHVNIGRSFRHTYIV